MLSNGHAGFGGRSEETHQWKRWQGASGRPNWPDILVIGEGDLYELNGMEGAFEAAAALRAAGGPAYVPHPCSLPREGGMFAPVIYVDPIKIVVRRFYSHRLPDFASRNRNLLVFTLPDRTDPIRSGLLAGTATSTQATSAWPTCVSSTGSPTRTSPAPCSATGTPSPPGPMSSRPT
ncbi:hypothetical protein [Actinomadura chokoriensis]|uniref:hypothetical protein n=1 Tax=Actinomadura chokoriensis TaxID=454156 RepID=UPI0031F77CB5